MVKGIINTTTTFYPGRHYNLELTGTGDKARKFYFVGMMTITVGIKVGESNNMQWILSEPINSTTVTANEDGTWKSILSFATPEVLREEYTAFGELRASSGLTATTYCYTGQLAQDVLELD